MSVVGQINYIPDNESQRGRLFSQGISVRRVVETQVT